MVASPPNSRRPASPPLANSEGSPESLSSPSNTHPIPSASTFAAPTSAHSYFPPPEPLSINHRPGSKSHSAPPSPSTTFKHPPSPQSHDYRNKPTPAAGTTLSQKPSPLIMLHEHPPSPFTLTSTLAPPSLIPMTAAGISAKPSAKKTSRKSPAASLKLSMLPSTMSPITPTSNSGNAATPAFTFSSHHHQAYAHSLSTQQQLQLHQKEIIHQATRATGIPQHLLSTGPMSPRLIPLGSPGPVTPLTLEDNPDGFFASSHGFGHQQLSQQLSIVASGQRAGL